MNGDDNYPRGGTKPQNIITAYRENIQENLFNTHVSKPKSSVEKKKTLTKTNDIPGTLQNVTADVLSYNKIQEGMLILGCIRNITSLTLNVELPGRTFGTLQVNCISDAFTQHLSRRIQDDSINEEEELNTLKNIFSSGQFIPTKVLQLQDTENGTNVLLTMKPNQINSNYSHLNYKEGMLIWAAVTEKSDHGYLLDVGVQNTRIILPFQFVDACKNYVIGEPLWCVVRSAKISKEASTITVNALKTDINSYTEKENSSLDYVIPGMTVDFSVQKLLKDGLEGTFFTSCTGYINSLYLSVPLESKEKYEGRTIKAYVLYIQPTTKFTYFTLRNCETLKPPILKKGQILSAQVLTKIGKGIILKLNKTEKGFITYRRILNSLKMNDNSKLVDMLNKKYPIGSRHQCRILDYMKFDTLYICTFEQSILNENVFTSADLKVGQIVKGIVEEINKSGIVVKIGNVNAFVTNEHITNVLYSDNIKNQYSRGQSITARIWDIKDSASVKLTMKQVFLESDVCLKSYEEAEVNSQYPGLIVKLTPNGALVAFYGGVRGWLKKKNNDTNFMKRFFHGAVILTTVLYKEGTRLTLTLDSPTATQVRRLQLGQIYNGKIVKISHDGITVTVDSKGTNGFIPVTHLSSNVCLANVMLGLYQWNDEIRNLVCISNDKIQILSIREYYYYGKKKYIIPKFNQLKKDDIIRCYLRKFEKQTLTLCSPMYKVVGVSVIAFKEDYLKDLEQAHLQPYQIVLARVKHVDRNKKIVQATVKLSDVFDYNMNSTVAKFEKYLEDVRKIYEILKNKEDPIAEFKVGQQVYCKVKNVGAQGCSVLLQHDVFGLVDIKQCCDNVRSGDEVLGVVLWIDYVHRCVELSIKPKIINKVNLMQDGIIREKTFKSIPAEILLVRPDFVICLLHGIGNGQLAFIPTELHENDFSPSFKYYENIRMIKFVMPMVTHNKIIGFEKKHIHYLAKLAKEYNTCNVKKERQDLKTKRKSSFTDDGSAKRIKLNDSDSIAIHESNRFDIKQNKILHKEEHNNRFKVANVKESPMCMNDEEKDTDDSNIVEEEDENYSVEKNVEDIDSGKENVEDMDSCEEYVEDTDNNEENVENMDNGEENVEDMESGVENVENMETSEENVASSEEDVHDEPSLENDVCAENDKVHLNTEEKTVKKEEEESYEENNDIEQKTKIVNENIQNNKINVNNICEQQTSTTDTDTDMSDDENYSETKTPTTILKTSKKLKQDKNVKFSQQNVVKEFRNADLVVIPDVGDKPVLSGIQNFFDISNEHSSTSSEDEAKQITPEVKQKKKKLTASEKSKMLRQQEDNLRRIEEEYANPDTIPQTAEQFDRKLLADPNSSELWAQYVAFHIQSTEIDKARAVLRRALNSIQHTAVQDRLNMWISYMNLENLYGTKEVFDKVFEEAVRCNDALTIYLEAIEILSSSSNPTNLEEKLKKVKAKFNQDPRMYTEIGKIYYKLKRFSDARKLKDNALRTLRDKKRHIPLLVQFAIMECNIGEESQGESIFETILQSAPIRTDVWSTYVDQLIKKNKIVLARKVLERAVAQKIGYKRLRILFKKFRDFEEKYGTEETKARQNQMLKEFLSQMDAK